MVQTSQKPSPLQNLQVVPAAEQGVLAAPPSLINSSISVNPKFILFYLPTTLDWPELFMQTSLDGFSPSDPLELDQC